MEYHCLKSQIAIWVVVVVFSYWKINKAHVHEQHSMGEVKVKNAILLCYLWGWAANASTQTLTAAFRNQTLKIWGSENMFAASADSEVLPPVHRCFHSYSLTPAQVDLQGSLWLSHLISSQPGWPICSCGWCPPLCHLCVPRCPSETGNQCIPYGTHVTSRGSGYFKDWSYLERKIINFCLFKHICGTETFLLACWDWTGWQK